MKRNINVLALSFYGLFMFSSTGLSFATELPEMEELVDISKPLFHNGSSIKSKWLPAPDMLPEGALVQILDGNPAQAGPFTIRIKLPENYAIPAHWNFSDEHITVISGTLHLGVGDKLEKNKAKKSTAGSYLRIPAKMHHYAWNKEETVIQLHGMGPWGLMYLDDATGKQTQAAGGSGNAAQDQDQDLATPGR